MGSAQNSYKYPFRDPKITTFLGKGTHCPYSTPLLYSCALGAQLGLLKTPNPGSIYCEAKFHCRRPKPGTLTIHKLAVCRVSYIQLMQTCGLFDQMLCSKFFAVYAATYVHCTLTPYSTTKRGKMANCSLPRRKVSPERKNVE